MLAVWIHSSSFSDSFEVLSFPEVHGCIRTPRAPGFGRIAKPTHGRLAPDALSNPRSPAGKASGQRKARMAMYWAVQSPIPGNSTSAAAIASGSGPGSRSISTRRHGLGDGSDARGTRRGDPERASAQIPCGRQSLRPRAQTVKARNGVSIGSPKRGHQPAGEGRRSPHRHALTQDRAHRQLEAVERARHAQARAPRRRHSRAGRQPRGATRSRRASRSGRRGSSREREPRAKPASSDVASSTATTLRARDRLDFQPAVMIPDSGRPEVSLSATDSTPAVALPRETASSECQRQRRPDMPA